MEAANNRNDKEFNQIMSQIWGLFDILKKSGEYPSVMKQAEIVLLLLSIHKDGLNWKDLLSPTSVLKESEGEYGNVKKNDADVYKALLQLDSSKIDNQTFEKIAIELFKLEGEVLDNNFAQIFDTIIYQLSISQARLAGEFIQPVEITRFICDLAELKPDAKVYNPFAGLASFGVYLNKVKEYFGQELNPNNWVVGVLRLMAYNKLPNAQYILADSVVNWPEDIKFDLIVSNPPLGMQIQHEEFFIERSKPCNIEDFFIPRGIEGLSSKGKLIGLFSTAVLFKGGATEKERKYAVDNDFLEMVVSLPTNLSYSTAISRTILVFAKNKNIGGHVKFVDGTSFFEKQGRVNVLLTDKLLTAIENNDSQFVRLVSNDEIRENEYNLNVTRYFYQEQVVSTYPDNFYRINLGDVVSVNRAKSSEDKTGRVVKSAYLKNESFNSELKSSDIEAIDIPLGYHKISSNVLLLSRINSLNPTYCIVEESVFVNSNIVALNIDTTKINLPFLILQLHSDHVKRYISRISNGSTVPFMSLKDILNIPLYIGNLNDQQKIFDNELRIYQSAKIKELGIELDSLKVSLKNEYEKKIRFRKHAIGQEIFDLQQSFSAFLKFVSQHDGIVDEKMIFSTRTNSTLKDTYISMNNTINQISTMVKNIAEEYDFGVPEKIDIIEFLSAYCLENKGHNYSFEFHHSYPLAEEDVYAPDLDENNNYIGDMLLAHKGEIVFPPTILISKESLRQILANIKNNAIKHGFTSKERNDYIIFINVEKDGDSVLISISNNGNPLKNGMSEDSFFINDRHGNIEIKNRVEQAGGKVSLVSDNNSKFPVGILIKFKDKSIAFTL